MIVQTDAPAQISEITSYVRVKKGNNGTPFEINTEEKLLDSKRRRFGICTGGWWDWTANEGAGCFLKVLN